MKRTVKVKNLIAFAAVLILLFSITAIPAYAEFPPLTTAGRRLGAFLLSAIQAINITLTSTAAQSPGADIMNYIADPMNVQYSYSEMWEDQPKIQIWKDYINIDGVDYTDIWLSNEAATKFQVDAYDFRSAYNIASNSNGTFASGDGTWQGIPFFKVGNVTRSQNYYIPKVEYLTPGQQYSIGDTTLETSYYNVTNSKIRQTEPLASSDCYYNEYIYYTFTNPNVYLNTNRQSSAPVNNNLYPFDGTDFDFDWVSENIPAQRVLDPDEGMMLRIPSDRIPAIDNFIQDNPEFVQPDGAPIDVNIDPDIMTKLDDLIDIIAPIIPIIRAGDIQFTVNHNQPAPVINNLLPDTYKQEILQPITENFQETQNTINQMGDTIVENIPKIDEICNNIDTAPYHDLDTGLDNLPSVLLPFITDLRSALGIWHYVTEWINQISTTFAFVTGCLVGTSIMTPIYAAIAGFMCIKVYRRMTG